MGLKERDRQTFTPMAQRSRHRGARGMTIVELLVSISILATIGGALGGAFAAGLHVLAPTGAQARLVGSHDLLGVEAHLSADIARASCLDNGGSSETIPSGGCTASAFPAKCGPQPYQLCIAWYSPGDQSCHTVIYAYKFYFENVPKLADRMIVRVDRSTNALVQLTTDAMDITASWKSVATSSNHDWTREVSLTLTQAGAAAIPVTSLFIAAPLSADPASSLAPTHAGQC